MSLDGVAVRPTLIAGANPVSKVAAALIIAVVLVFSVDVVSAGTALALECLLLPATGAPVRQIIRVLAPIAISAVLAGVVTAFIGVDSGAVLAAIGPLTLTEGSVRNGLAIALRVLAIALPSIALLASTDPTDLADALGQRLHLPATFVLGALAGLRLVGVLVAQWRSLTMARRMRGLGDSNGPWGATRVMAGQGFALLVLALRRATRLAMAMQARGFGSPTARTWARPSTFSGRDAVVIAGAVFVCAAAVGCALWMGTWTFIWDLA
ncbi:MAG: energy-coupling factor transporter transmembrane component T family protein [Actinomycetales bacterium]